MAESKVTTIQERERQLRSGPKSKCECGHTGDGPESQHLGIAPRAGHGACTVDGCGCERFRWAGWLNGHPAKKPGKREPWRCLYCGAELLIKDNCRKPECVGKYEAARKRMGFATEGAE